MRARWAHFRIDDELYEEMRAAAIADSRTLSNWLALIVRRALTADATADSHGPLTSKEPPT